MTPSLTEKAMRIALFAHKNQVRKGDGLPYIIHPAMVALKLAKHNFSDITLAVALTHDVLEDTDFSEEELKNILGEEVLKIVKIVTQEKNLLGKERKIKYIEAIYNGPMEAKAVAVADKIHNLESLLLAYQEKKEDLWKHFNMTKEEKFKFEDAVLKMLKETWSHPLIEEYENLIKKAKIILNIKN